MLLIFPKVSFRILLLSIIRRKFINEHSFSTQFIDFWGKKKMASDFNALMSYSPLYN